jgi:uncharacterized protein
MPPQSRSSKSIQQEKRYLALLRARGLEAVEIPGEEFDVSERTALSREVMRAGAAVIYKAALVAPPWLGYADFLQRVEDASNLGAWSYETLDTKLPRKAKPEHVIQLATYSKLIGVAQDCMPTEMLAPFRKRLLVRRTIRGSYSRYRG